MTLVSYHQTQSMLNRQEVERYVSTAERQDDVVLAVFRERAGQELSPEDVHGLVLQDAPLTSVRRAITNLTNNGWLVRTDGCKVGRYGRKVGLWRLAGGQLTLF
jgi:hypothetical protein